MERTFKRRLIKAQQGLKYTSMYPNGVQSKDAEFDIDPSQIITGEYPDNQFNFPGQMTPRVPMQDEMSSIESLKMPYSASQQQEDVISRNLQVTDSNLGDYSPYTPQDDEENPFGKIQFINPYGGVDIPSAAGYLGQSIENKDSLGIVTSGLKLATGLGRNIFGGIGEQKRKNWVMNDYYEKQRNDLTRPVVAEDGGFFFQKGGKMDLSKGLTGEYMTGMDKENPIDTPNAEIEKGEYVKNPSGETQQVIGNTHEKGGEDVKLEDGTKILSDHLKIGVSLAKEYKKKYELELKASDTYATVLDKYGKKSGLSKIVEEQEDWIKKLEKQQKETQDEETLGLNVQTISNKINELEKEKTPLEEARKALFEELFKEQEDSKPKDKKSDMYQDGGFLTELSQKYNVPFERVQELLAPMFQSGGSFRIPSQYENPDLYIKQHEINPNTANYGQLLQNNPSDIVSSIADLHPEIYQQMFENGKLKKGFTPFDYQKAINEKYNVIADDYARTYGKDSSEYKNLLAQINQDNFLGTDVADENIRARDNKMGNYTVTRPNFILNLLPEEELSKVNKDGVKTVWQLKNKFPDIYKKYVEPKGVKSDAYLGKINEEKPVEAVTKNNVPLQGNLDDGSEDKLSLLLLPDQNPMMPSSLQPHLKINRRFDRVDPAFVSPEQNLVEINRQQTAVTDQINNLPGAQRSAALASISANSSDSMNKVISETNKINSQIQSQTDARNATIQATEENAAAQDALSYEQRQYMAMAKTDNDVRNYFNTLQSNNTRNWNEVNEMNLLNAMYNDFQFNGSTVEKTSPNIHFGALESYKSPEQQLLEMKAQAKANTKKPKAKLGGRFKK